MTEEFSSIPAALRVWFILHAAVDLLLAVPLMVSPIGFLEFLGMHASDTVLPRLVAAALIAIGLQSWIGRNEGREAVKAMLNLKIAWASSAVAGLLWSLADGAPPIVWGVAGLFGAFLAVWLSYRIGLARVFR